MRASPRAGRGTMNASVTARARWALVTTTAELTDGRAAETESGCTRITSFRVGQASHGGGQDGGLARPIDEAGHAASEMKDVLDGGGGEGDLGGAVQGELEVNVSGGLLGGEADEMVGGGDALGQGGEDLQAEALAKVRAADEDDGGGRVLVHGGVLEDAQLAQRGGRQLIGLVEDQQRHGAGVAANQKALADDAGALGSQTRAFPSPGRLPAVGRGRAWSSRDRRDRERCRWWGPGLRRTHVRWPSCPLRARR